MSPQPEGMPRVAQGFGWTVCASLRGAWCWGRGSTEGPCGQAVRRSGRSSLEWALIPRQVDVQKPSNALYKAKAGLLFSIERFPR